MRDAPRPGRSSYQDLRDFLVLIASRLLRSTCTTNNRAES